MKRCIAMALSAFLLITSGACGRQPISPSVAGTPPVMESPSAAPKNDSAQSQGNNEQPTEPEQSESNEDMTSIIISTGNAVFSAKLYDNGTAKAFLARLPITLNMSELNGNEKYYYLTEGLPADSQQVGSINAGDLMLYGSDCLVLFYESFTTLYSYTKIGNIENVTGLADALGDGSAEVTFSVSE